MNVSLFNTLVPALLHTLWIGLIAAAGLFLALRIIPSRRTQLRYALSIAALLSLFLGGLVAWELPAKPAPRAAPVVQATEIETAPVAISNPQPIATPSAAAVEQNPTHTNWRQWLGIIWMAGATLSLLRLIRISFAIRKQIRQSRIVDNPAVMRLTAELAKVAGISRRIALLTGEHIVQPAVTGIFRPAIFLPLSAVTGLPEWQLRAILAHEIAHIARHDFLINALQLLSETVLFFNPAAWWIHRRIREEREACCDALAARWIDSSHELAETLIEQAATIPSALPAFGDSGTVKGRIQRLLGQQPHLKLPWKSLLLVTLFATAGLVIAQRGTAKAVGYLKRLETLTEIQGQYDDPAKAIARTTTNLFDEITVEIPVRIPKESSSIFPAAITLLCGPNGYETTKSLTENNIIKQSEDRVLLKLSLNRLYSQIGCITHFAIEGQNIAHCESTGAAADEYGIIRLPEIELFPGFEGRLRFLSPDRSPVTNVSVAICDQAGYYKLQKTEKYYSLSHCSSTPVSFSMIPPDGFVYEHRKITFEPNKVTDWILQPGIPFSGTILNQQGNPVVGAEIRLAGGPGNTIPWRVNEYNVVAVTDTSGRFSFTRMTTEDPYNLLFIADGYMGKASGLITAQDNEQTFTLRPQKRLEVRLKNMQLLKRNNLEFSTPIRLNQHGAHNIRLPEEWCTLVSSNSTSAVYKLNNLWEGDSAWYARNNTLCMGNLSHDFDPLKIGDTLTIDIADKLSREKQRIPHTFTIRLVPPNNEPTPQGTMEIWHVAWLGRVPSSYSIPPNGEIQAKIKTISNSEIRIKSKAITGYKVDHTFTADSTNMVVDVPLIPTGCIMITCTDENGNPQKDYSVTVETQGQIPVYDGSSTINNRVYIDSTIALDQPIRVRIWKTTPDGNIMTEHWTDWFTLTEDQPVKKITCTLRDPRPINVLQRLKSETR